MTTKLFNDYFDAVYVINLEKRVDRFKQVSEEMTKHRINFTRFLAVDGSLLDGSFAIKKGVMGCKMSHELVYEDIAKNGYKTAAIFEDDVYLHEDFNNLFEQFYNELPKDWDFVYLGGNNWHPTIKVSEHIERTVCTYALHGYLVTLKTAERFTNAARKGLFNSKIDANLDRFMHENKMNVYIFNPKIAFQRAGYSDNLKKIVNYDNVLNNKN